MSLIETIAKNNYAATPDEVERLAREYAASLGMLGATRGTYLRVLLAGVQVELTGKPTLRAPRGPSATIPDESRTQALAALEAVHSRLYPAVLKGAIPEELADNGHLRPEERRRRARERNRRTNYARSAAATVRGYVRSGGDIRRVAVPTATKGALARSPTGPTVTAEQAASRRVQRAAARLAGAVEALAEADKALAAAALQDAMAQVSGLLLKYGRTPVSKPEQAVAQHRLLRTPEGMFWPAQVEHRTQ